MMRHICSWWPWSRKRKKAELAAETAALDAAKEAEEMHTEAILRAGAVEHQANRIKTMNDINHFSQSLTQAFGGRP